MCMDPSEGARQPGRLRLTCDHTNSLTWPAGCMIRLIFQDRRTVDRSGERRGPAPRHCGLWRETDGKWFSSPAAPPGSVSGSRRCSPETKRSDTTVKVPSYPSILLRTVIAHKQHPCSVYTARRVCKKVRSSFPQLIKVRENVNYLQTQGSRLNTYSILTLRRFPFSLKTLSSPL